MEMDRRPGLKRTPHLHLTFYGHTKLAGERAIQESGCRHAIVRTSWVYDEQGQNFLRTMLRLGQERDSLSVINDQIGAPTSAALIAESTARLLSVLQSHPERGGLYHLAAKGETSWHGYARFILETARARGLRLTIEPEAITAIPSTAYATLSAQRPLNSRLNTQKIEQTLNTALPPWQEDVAQTVGSILTS